MTIIDKITAVIKSKVETRFDSVKSTVRETRYRLIRQAAEDLLALQDTKFVQGKPNCIHETYALSSVSVFESLRSLEALYGNYSRRICKSLAEAERLSAQGSQHIKDVIRKHDRNVHVHAQKIPVLATFPESVRQWT